MGSIWPKLLLATFAVSLPINSSWLSPIVSWSVEKDNSRCTALCWPCYLPSSKLRSPTKKLRKSRLGGWRSKTSILKLWKSSSSTSTQKRWRKKIGRPAQSFVRHSGVSHSTLIRILMPNKIKKSYYYPWKVHSLEKNTTYLCWQGPTKNNLN